MLGLTFEGVTEIRRKLGYRIIEDASKMKTTIINVKGEKVAEISVDEEGSLQIMIGEEKLEALEWIHVGVGPFPRCPKKLVIQARDFEGKDHWSELPLQEGSPVFW